VVQQDAHSPSLVFAGIAAYGTQTQLAEFGSGREFRRRVEAPRNSVITLHKRITLPSCSVFGGNVWHNFVHGARCEGTLPFSAVLLEPA
jgi:hypothetical protein